MPNPFANWTQADVESFNKRHRKPGLRVELEPGAVKDKPKKRLRQSSKPLMNKLESAFYETIRNQYPNLPPVRAQAKTYRLANGLRYTPDFTATSWPQPLGPAKETAWEVKGKWVDGDSFPKLKMAASAWPEVRFVLVWLDEGKNYWHEQEILP